MNLKRFISIAAILVFGICVYSFLLDNKVFQGEFEEEKIEVKATLRQHHDSSWWSDNV